MINSNEKMSEKKVSNLALLVILTSMLIIISAIPVSVYSITFLTEVVSTESTDNSYYPSLAVDPDGNIHVAWYDDTDYGGAGTDADVFYKRLEAVISLSDIMAEVDNIELKLDSILDKLGLPPVGGFILPKEELSYILNMISENLVAVALIIAAVMVYLLLTKRMS